MMLLDIQTGRRFLARLDQGEEIIETLQKIAGEKNIGTGFFFGIGAVRKASFGCFVGSGEYTKIDVEEGMEITSLVGNITLKQGAHAVHAHIQLADRKGVVRGGHLHQAVVDPTCELLIQEARPSLTRRFDQKTKLWLLDKT